jgi:hypothetical protein
VTTPKDVVVTTETNADDVVETQILLEHDVTVTNVVVSSVMTSVDTSTDSEDEVSKPAKLVVDDSVEDSVEVVASGAIDVV